MLYQEVQDFSRVQELVATKQYNKAFYLLVQLSNHYSKNEAYLKILSHVQAALGDYVAREKTLKALSAVTGSDMAVIDYSLQLIKNGKMNLAEEQLKSLDFSLLSENLKMVYIESLISIYAHQNHFVGIESVTQLLEKNELLNEMYYYGKALLELHFGLEDAAISSLRQAVTLRDHFEQAWVALGLLHERRGDFELAQANFEKALDYNPLNSVALKFLAQGNIRAGQFEQSMKKVGFYLQNYNFDEEMTLNYIQLLDLAQQNDVAQREVEKIFYFSGKNIAT